jgi:hypothetical protein
VTVSIYLIRAVIGIGLLVIASDVIAQATDEIRLWLGKAPLLPILEARAEAGADTLLALGAQLQPDAAGGTSGRLEARG